MIIDLRHQTVHDLKIVAILLPLVAPDLAVGLHRAYQIDLLPILLLTIPALDFPVLLHFFKHLVKLGGVYLFLLKCLQLLIKLTPDLLLTASPISRRLNQIVDLYFNEVHVADGFSLARIDVLIHNVAPLHLYRDLRLLTKHINYLHDLLDLVGHLPDHLLLAAGVDAL